jgi:hypothetical protein
MISEEFLGIPYRGFTLVGDREIPERLVIDLEGMDCFTFLDYVEAIRLSRSADDFPHALIGVRYREAQSPSITGTISSRTGPFLLTVRSRTLRAT